MPANPPAFPVAAGMVDVVQPGMTLKDYLAGQALAAMLLDEASDPTPETVATRCYGIADAMLVERAKAVAS